MGNSADPLGTEISVETSLTETGATAKVKSRTISAFDRLGGNLIDWLNLPVESSNSRRRAIMQAERAVIDTGGKALVAQIKVDPVFAERAIANHMEKVLRKQENKEAVIRVAHEELKKLPAPEEGEADDTTDVLSEDWLNFFEPIAEKASSDKMRGLFGRILSGEIRKPGAPRTTF